MINVGTQNIQGVLFDLDGVIYIGDKLIAGASDVLASLRQQNIPYRFITNTSTRTVADVADKLRGLGLKVETDHIFSAVSATRAFLQQQVDPSVHFLIREAALDEFTEFRQDDPTPDYVVVGDIGAAWNYELLNRVFNELMNGAELIAMHMNKFWQGEDGLKMDIGAFVAGLEFVTGKQARIIGKPSQDFFQLATESLGLNCNEVCIVGDDIENDVGGGQAAGLRGILVRTGKFREEIAAGSEITPDAIIDSIADFSGLIES
ncbi:MAG: TIGR01458 family HAD-type hydrolase [Pseudohongiellaceae bacterium]